MFKTLSNFYMIKNGSLKKLKRRQNLRRSSIQNYWIDGPIPPQVWNCHSRKGDLTNNNNEGHNSYNNAIKETHPSPAKFTVAIVKELTMAETTLRRFQNGAERMVRAEYKKLNKRRKNLKKLYSTMDRLEYLSRMGNIVMLIQLNKGQMAEVRERERSATLSIKVPEEQ